MLNARIAWSALRCRFGKNHRPFVLSHLLTARCNADCQTCLWKAPADAEVDDLTMDEIAALYRDAAAVGCTTLVLWGGEPMIRTEIGEVLQAARDARLKTTLITNGWWLRERADELLPMVDRLMVSVDGMGERHDEIRRKPGLFERMDEGLQYLRETRPDLHVVINVVLSKLNADQLEAIAEYGKSRGDSVSFQVMNTSEYGAHAELVDIDSLQLSAEEEAEIAQKISELRRAGFPVTDSKAYLGRLSGDGREYRCHFKKVCLRVEPNGDILDCTTEGVALANVRQTSVQNVLRSSEFTDFLKRAESCDRCRDFGVVEVSNLWEGRVEALWNALKTLV